MEEAGAKVVEASGGGYGSGGEGDGGSVMGVGRGGGGRGGGVEEVVAPVSATGGEEDADNLWEPC